MGGGLLQLPNPSFFCFFTSGYVYVLFVFVLCSFVFLFNRQDPPSGQLVILTVSARIQMISFESVCG